MGRDGVQVGVENQIIFVGMHGYTGAGCGIVIAKG
jgi:hypothetical protein